jgi:hypothetical protein
MLMLAALTGACRQARAAECQWPDGAVTSQLLKDIALAEDIAIRYADALGYREGWRNTRQQCESVLFSEIAARRSISLEDVLTARTQLDRRGFDWAVNLPMIAFTIVAASLIGRYTSRRFAHEPVARTIAIIALTVSLASAVVAVGQLWAFLIEGLRIGSGHLSYRAARIPWAHHRPLTFALAFSIGTAIALLAPRTRYFGTHP